MIPGTTALSSRTRKMGAGVRVEGPRLAPRVETSRAMPESLPLEEEPSVRVDLWRAASQAALLKDSQPAFQNVEKHVEEISD
jgi:hypothetical protein